MKKLPDGRCRLPKRLVHLTPSGPGCRTVSFTQRQPAATELRCVGISTTRDPVLCVRWPKWRTLHTAHCTLQSARSMQWHSGQTCLVWTPVVWPLFNDMAHSLTSTPDGFISEPPALSQALLQATVRARGRTSRATRSRAEFSSLDCLRVPRQAPGIPDEAAALARTHLWIFVFGLRSNFSELCFSRVDISQKKSVSLFHRAVRLLAPARSPSQHSIFSMAATTCATWTRWT